MTKTSFGKYFDDQRDRIVKDMQTGKNTELYNAWREDFDKRQNALALRREGSVSLPYVDDNTPREELDTWTKTTAKATAKGIAAKEATYVDEDAQLFWWESIGT